MIRKNFKVQIYNWDITFLEVQSENDAGELDAYAAQVNAAFPTSIKDTINSVKNTGMCYIVEEDLKALVIILLSDDESQRRNTIGHEKRHLEDYILNIAGITDVESAGYIAGYLSQYMY